MNYRYFVLFFLTPFFSFKANDSCGKKHDNLVRLKSLCSGNSQVQIPEFFGVTSARVESFVLQHDSALMNNVRYSK